MWRDLGMTQQEIKEFIDQQASMSESPMLGRLLNIPSQPNLQPSDILQKMTYAIANAIAANNVAITQQLRDKGLLR